MADKDEMVELDYEISPNIHVPANVELIFGSNKNWTKYGDYICS